MESTGYNNTESFWTKLQARDAYIATAQENMKQNSRLNISVSLDFLYPESVS